MPTSTEEATERTANDGLASRHAIYSAALWLGLSLTVGTLASFSLVWPDWLRAVFPKELWPYIHFGRLRPVHVHIAIFGWLSTMYFAAMYYIVPRLAGVKLFSERLGAATVWFWNITMAAATVTLLMGMTQNREYGEEIWPIDLMVAITVVMLGINVFATVAKRRIKTMYVSLWYMMGSIIWLALLYIVGNKMWDPSGAFTGVTDPIINWWYGHNVIGMWFTTNGVAIAYYLIPLLAGRPLYSHKLSMIGFWSIAAIYPQTGAHHLIWGPVPSWLVSVAAVTSMMMIIPVWTVLTNFYKTASGNWTRFLGSVPGRFILMGSVFYFVTCLQGPTQSLRSWSAVVHFTHWVVGHAHLAMLGAFSFFSFAFAYHALPRLLGRRGMYSEALAGWHFWLSTLGFVIMAFDLWFAGIVQGTSWISGTPFIQVVVAMKPYMLTRALAGVIILTGQFLYIYNVFMTARQPERTAKPAAPRAA